MLQINSHRLITLETLIRAQPLIVPNSKVHMLVHAGLGLVPSILLCLVRGSGTLPLCTQKCVLV